jgi:hypothetical protein
MPMTKAEAICACNNILQLVEDLDELLSEKGREDYAGSINKKMTDMRQFILTQWRGERVTEKMDMAIRNTWSGLRKWDHEDAYNTELFDGLNDTILELQENASAPATATEEGDEEPRDVRTSEKKQKGREMTDDEMPAVPADAVPDKVLAPRPQTPSVPSTDRGAKAPESKSLATSTPTFASSNGSGLIDRELVAKAREKILELVRRQIDEKKISLVTTQTIMHSDLAALLNTTSSDRTRQLILSAFYSGKIAGVHALAQELIE